jgi:hypothetical protein
MKVQIRLLAGGVAGCAAAAVAVAGCGSSGSSSNSSSKEPSAAQLQSSVKQSVRDASSVKVNGQVSQKGVPVGVDLGLHRNGDMSGTISENGANLQVLSVGGKVYIKATPAFLKEVKAPADACAVMCGRWVELPAQEARQITGQLSMNSLTGVGATEAGSTTVDGQHAWVLKGTDGTKVAVSSANKHYPLQATGGSTGHGTLKFSQWNSVPPPTAPPAGQVVNLSGLQK